MAATGKNVKGTVAMFGPGVDRDVRFRQQGQSRHSLGFELMGGYVKNGAACTFCGFFQRRSDVPLIIKKVRVTAQ